MQEASIQVQNIVSSLNLETKLDLGRLVSELPNSEYNPDRFPALIARFREPKISFLIFGNGKIICTGANHITKVRGGVSKLVGQLRGLGIEIEKDPRITITNVVATADLGLELNLDEIALNLENVEYEPEVFPGLVYRPYESRASVLIFRNGKLVLAGLRDVLEARQVVEELVERLREAGLVPSCRRPQSIT